MPSRGGRRGRSDSRSRSRRRHGRERDRDRYRERDRGRRRDRSRRRGSLSRSRSRSRSSSRRKRGSDGVSGNDADKADSPVARAALALIDGADDGENDGKDKEKGDGIDTEKEKATDKEKDKLKDREKGRDRDKDRDRDRERDRDRRERRDREREKEKEKEKVKKKTGWDEPPPDMLPSQGVPDLASAGAAAAAAIFGSTAVGPSVPGVVEPAQLSAQVGASATVPALLMPGIVEKPPALPPLPSTVDTAILRAQALAKAASSATSQQSGATLASVASLISGKLFPTGTPRLPGLSSTGPQARQVPLAFGLPRPPGLLGSFPRTTPSTLGKAPMAPLANPSPTGKAGFGFPAVGGFSKMPATFARPPLGSSATFLAGGLSTDDRLAQLLGSSTAVLSNSGHLPPQRNAPGDIPPVCGLGAVGLAEPTQQIMESGACCGGQAGASANGSGNGGGGINSVPSAQTEGGRSFDLGDFAGMKEVSPALAALMQGNLC